MSPDPNPDDEMVWHVDDDDVVIQEIRRGDLTGRGLRHRSVAVLCRDAEGRILVHRRAAAKRVLPGHYDMFVAGMVAAGEGYDETAVRECAEEIGAVGVQPVFRGRFRFDHPEFPQWSGVYEAVVTGPIVPQTAEVAWFGFLTEAELTSSFGEWTYCPDSRALYDAVFVKGLIEGVLGPDA